MGNVGLAGEISQGKLCPAGEDFGAKGDILKKKGIRTSQCAKLHIFTAGQTWVWATSLHLGCQILSNRNIGGGQSDPTQGTRVGHLLNVGQEMGPPQSLGSQPFRDPEFSFLAFFKPNLFRTRSGSATIQEATPVAPLAW